MFIPNLWYSETTKSADENPDALQFSATVSK